MTFTSRVFDVVRALRAARANEAHERLAPAALRALQQERLERLVRHAAAHSPFYREHYRGLDLTGRIALADLPPVDKTALMPRFDDWVTDRRLRLADVEAHVDTLDTLRGDDLFLDEYRVCATSGSTGRRGLFLFSRAEWIAALAGGFRYTRMMGATPRLPRLRLAQVSAVHPIHMTARVGLSLEVGVHRVLRLDARRSVPELAAALAAFRPDVLMGYPSMLAMLADEQCAGRLAIAPRVVSTSSEVRTPEMEERITAAWGVRPWNLYASTETCVIAADCEQRAGLHCFEDQVLVENVDAGGLPVADGVPGARLLVTNLWNYTQPIVRYELTDIATMASAPCACGRTMRRIVALDGRSDDILEFVGRDGSPVAVHPLAIRSPFAGLSEVRAYQVIHDGSLHVRAVPRDGAAPEAVAARIREVLGEKLAALGVAPLPIEVEIVAALTRDAGPVGKLKLVESRPAPAVRRRANGA